MGQILNKCIMCYLMSCKIQFKVKVFSRHKKIFFKSWTMLQRQKYFIVNLMTIFICNLVPRTKVICFVWNYRVFHIWLTERELELSFYSERNFATRKINVLSFSWEQTIHKNYSMMNNKENWGERKYENNTFYLKKWVTYNCKKLFVTFVLTFYL